MVKRKHKENSMKCIETDWVSNGPKLKRGGFISKSYIFYFANKNNKNNRTLHYINKNMYILINFAPRLGIHYQIYKRHFHFI